MAIQTLQKRDVVIAGGGPAGIMAAIAAARNGANTLLVEQNGYVGGTAATGLPLLSFHNNRGERIVSGIPWELIKRLMEMEEAVVARIAGANSGLHGQRYDPTDDHAYCFSNRICSHNGSRIFGTEPNIVYIECSEDPNVRVFQARYY